LLETLPFAVSLLGGLLGGKKRVNTLVGGTKGVFEVPEAFPPRHLPF